jgi:hypothetical protein
MATVYTPESPGVVISEKKETVIVYQSETNTVREWLREEVEGLEETED